MSRTFRLFMFLWLLAAVPSHAQNVEYIHTDALGSPVAVTDANRNVIERSEYEPYGQVINRPLRDGPGYTGHVEDAATGLVYAQQRYYDPSIGRFLSVDPVTANSGTGANFNRYWYAANNPYKFVDPDGRLVRNSQERISGEQRAQCQFDPRCRFALQAGRMGQGSSHPEGDREEQVRRSPPKPRFRAQSLSSGRSSGGQQADNQKESSFWPKTMLGLAGDAKAFVGIYGRGVEGAFMGDPAKGGTCSTLASCHYIGVGLYGGGGAGPAGELGNMSAQEMYFGIFFEGGAIAKGSLSFDFNGKGVAVSTSEGAGAGAVIAAKVCTFEIERGSGC